MKLAEFAAVFNRYFVVGFFVPTFFGLAAAAFLATPQFLPNAIERYPDWTTRLLVIGALAVPLGLLLQGFHPALLRAFQQHPSGADPYRFLPAWLVKLLLKPERREFGRLQRLRDDPAAPTVPWLYRRAAESWNRLRWRAGAAEPVRTSRETRTTAAARLQERYPADLGNVLPTRIGNALLATQDYLFARWGFDIWTTWPRIEPLVGEQEQALLDDARTEVAFFLNAAIAAVAVGVFVVVDEIAHQPLGVLYGWLYLLPFLLAYSFYRLSVGAVVRWGEHRRAAVELHRLELLEKLGVVAAETEQTRYEAARALNRRMLFRAPAAADGTETELVAFSLGTNGRLVPLAEEQARRLDWKASSEATLAWLKDDCVLHGYAVATVAGDRVEPHDVVIGNDRIPRWRRSVAATQVRSDGA